MVAGEKPALRPTTTHQCPYAACMHLLTQTNVHLTLSRHALVAGAGAGGQAGPSSHALRDEEQSFPARPHHPYLLTPAHTHTHTYHPPPVQALSL